MRKGGGIVGGVLGGLLPSGGRGNFMEKYRLNAVPKNLYGGKAYKKSERRTNPHRGEKINRGNPKKVNLFDYGSFLDSEGKE